MAHDPIADVALGPLLDVLQRYLQVVDVLASAIDALKEKPEPLHETACPPAEPSHVPPPSLMSIEKRHELETILAFQERLSEVLGVATVTLEGSSAQGFRFLVEMDHPPY